MSDTDNYMTDPRTHKISGFIASFEVFKKYMKPYRNGFEADPIDAAEHDIIYSCVSAEQCPEESNDGQLLRSLGWHEENGYWAMYV
jgi:hypothetical protein